MKTNLLSKAIIPFRACASVIKIFIYLREGATSLGSCYTHKTRASAHSAPALLTRLTHPRAHAAPIIRRSYQFQFPITAFVARALSSQYSTRGRGRRRRLKPAYTRALALSRSLFLSRNKHFTGEIIAKVPTLFPYLVALVCCARAIYIRGNLSQRRKDLPSFDVDLSDLVRSRQPSSIRERKRDRGGVERKKMLAGKLVFERTPRAHTRFLSLACSLFLSSRCIYLLLSPIREIEFKDERKIHKIL